MNSIEVSYKILRDIPSKDIVESLKEKLEENQDLNNHLIYSLEKANQLALKKLDSSLYQALEWPLTVSDYLNYLNKYLKKIPTNSSEKCWLNQGYSKEVLDRLCHFHMLVGMDLEEEQCIDGYYYTQVQEHPWFKDWLVDFCQKLGEFLDSPESMNQETFMTFYNTPEYHVEDSMIWDEKRQYYHSNNPSGWLTFNQFFARKLNTGVRQIKSPGDNTVITSPTYCTYKEQFPIQRNGQIPEVTIKHSHKYGDIQTLLDNSEYTDDFKNGTFIHYFLNVNDYHRFHSIVDGKVLESKVVQGQTKCGYTIMENGRFDIPDDATEGYEFCQTRGVVIVDTKDSQYGNIGKVAMIPVGMTQVSSVILSSEKDTHIQKGDEFGYFQFGGSDIILLFQPNQGINLFEQVKHYRYGDQIGFVQNSKEQQTAKIFSQISLQQKP